jgi:hypothetical protein
MGGLSEHWQDDKRETPSRKIARKAFFMDRCEFNIP